MVCTIVEAVKSSRAVHYELGSIAIIALHMLTRNRIWPSTKAIGMVWIGNIRPA